MGFAKRSTHSANDGATPALSSQVSRHAQDFPPAKTAVSYPLGMARDLLHFEANAASAIPLTNFSQALAHKVSR
jgi:hypothetical protein